MEALRECPVGVANEACGVLDEAGHGVEGYLTFKIEIFCIIYITPSTMAATASASTETHFVDVTGWWGDCSVKISDTSLLGRLKRTVVHDVRQQGMISAIDSRNAQSHIAITPKSRPQDPEALAWITNRPYILRREDLRVATADTIEITFGGNPLLPEVHFTVVHIPKLREKNLAAVTQILDIAWNLFFDRNGKYWLTEEECSWIDALVIEDETKKAKREKKEKKERSPRHAPAGRADESAELRAEVASLRAELSALRVELSNVRVEMSEIRSSNRRTLATQPFHGPFYLPGSDSD
jgi:hypothetical protein